MKEARTLSASETAAETKAGRTPSASEAAAMSGTSTLAEDAVLERHYRSTQRRECWCYGVRRRSDPIVG